MIISVTSSNLTIPATRIEKVRYFPIELRCVGMFPNTTYDFYVDGVLMNAFCKPFGKNLGAPMIAGQDGTLLVQYHMSLAYNQQYLQNKVDENGYVAQNKMFEFRDPNGNSSVTYYPVRLKASQ